MGGLMSGFQGRRKLTTGEVLSLYVNKVGIKNDINFTGVVTWKNGNCINIIKKAPEYVTLSYANTQNGQEKSYKYDVGLDYTACNYGGVRPWFICPDCGKRVGVLYLRYGVFKCRSCHNLNYSIQQEDKLDRQFRSIDKKMYKIQDRLKAERSTDIWYIPKPKGMHYKTYEYLRRKLDKLYIKRGTFFSTIAMQRFGIEL